MKEGQDQMVIVVNGNEWEQNLSKLGEDLWKPRTDVRTQSLFPGDSAEYGGPLLGFNTRAPDKHTASEGLWKSWETRGKTSGTG